MQTTEYTHNDKGQRIDVHAPRVINPANYELAAPLSNAPWYQSGPFFDLGSVSGTCYHCGHAIRYATKMVYLPTGEKVTFGADCTDLIDLDPEVKTRAGYEFKRLKKRAANEKKALRMSQEKSERFESFSAQHPAIVEMLENLTTEDLSFLHSMKHALDHWGWLTDGQVNAVKNIQKKREEYIARKIEQAMNDVEPTAPVEEGRYQTTGEILNVKGHDDPQWGFSYKMLVRLDDNGCKVYGTLPSALYADVDAKTLEGKKITFTAKFTPKQNDAFFAYFNRPAKASVA